MKKTKNKKTKNKETKSKVTENKETKSKITKNKEKKKAPQATRETLTGVFFAHQKGYGFVEDIFIPPSKTNGALNKDTVLILVHTKMFFEPGKEKEGEVIKIIKRGSNFIVGRFYRHKKYCTVIPDDIKNSFVINIPKKSCEGLITGHKVAVKLTMPPLYGDYAEGVIEKVIGHVNDPGTDILSIAYSHDIPVEFPEEALMEAKNIPDIVLPEDCIGRRNLTKQMIITIDGEDTKDIDDAISLEVMEKGYKLGVHIADVSHYVGENSALDKEAVKRGTSVYPPGSVIPMLPRELSNGICSLNEGELRLTLSCIMKIDKNGGVISHEICNSFIKVKKRFTYTEVDGIITHGDPELCEKNKPYINLLHNMKELSDLLRGNRFKRGAIDFNLKEAHITLDEKGKASLIESTGRNAATELIEEFMIACNETIAKSCENLPFIYRCHDKPEYEKMKSIQLLAADFGYNFKAGSKSPKAVQSLLKKASGMPEEMFLSRIILRSFSQARYKDENIGHYGLASECYCHFTSPIRRYPDLLIHRIIKENISGLNKKHIKHFKKITKNLADHLSLTERRAVDCEREAVQLKKVEFMQNKIGEVYNGIISGVTHKGFFVELDNTVDGMVTLESLGYGYSFDEIRHCLTNAQGNSFRLGQPVKVEISHVNMAEKRINMELLSAQN